MALFLGFFHWQCYTVLHGTSGQHAKTNCVWLRLRCQGRLVSLPSNDTLRHDLPGCEGLGCKRCREFLLFTFWVQAFWHAHTAGAFVEPRLQ